MPTCSAGSRVIFTSECVLGLLRLKLSTRITNSGSGPFKEALGTGKPRLQIAPIIVYGDC